MHGELTFNVVVMVMGLLFVASVVAITARRFRFPYTIALVVIGLFMGWAIKVLPALHPLTAFQLTPEVLFYVFLPALLFESAFNLDARSLLKNVLPIAVLAVPALLISTAVVGFILHYTLALPIGLALLFGSLISATDPVAVVALFKEMGAPKRLTLLVEGESLFNDGTALVVFKIILGAVIAGSFTSFTVLRGVMDFLVVASGGIGIGIAFGVLFSKMIEMVKNERLVEITLTTILAHTTFLAAEHAFHVSGVMATVSAGLTMGSYGRNKISPQVQEHMESFWEYFAFVSNSLIFLLVGLSIDMGLFMENAPAVLVAALAVTAARALGVYSLFPAIGRSHLAEKVDRRVQTVVFWGGLRGALAIVMALSIPEDLPQRDFLLVLTLGVVLFSLLLNGLTVKRLMSVLGLDRYSLKERFERAQAMIEAKEKVLEKLPDFARDEAISDALFKKTEKKYKKGMDSIRGEVEKLKGEVHEAGESEMVLKHSLLTERKSYRKLFEEGMLSEDNLKEMLITIDKQLDRLKEDRKVDMPRRHFFLSRLTVKLDDVPLAAALLRRYKTRKIAAGYELERARFVSSSLVLKGLEKMEAQGSISPSAIKRARTLYADLHEKAASRIEELKGQYPEYVEKADAGILKRFCMGVELETFRELYSQGAVTEKVLQEMEDEIGDALRRMKMRPVSELPVSPTELIRAVPYCRGLTEAELMRLASRFHARSFLRGEEIIRQGEMGRSLYIIGRGKVDVIRDNLRLTGLGPGDFFGETALFHPQPRTATVRAATPCILLELGRKNLMQFLEHAPHMREALEEAYRKRVLNTLIAEIPLFRNLSATDRDSVVSLMDYRAYDEGETIEKDASGGMLYVVREGEIEVIENEARVSTLRRGDFIGHESLLEGTPAWSGLRALSKAEVYTLDSARLKENADLMRAIK
jgi:CPA1 family monovalent cation:H+ antiporter